MAQQGGFFFKIGYYLYTNTCLGSWYYNRDVKKAKQQFEIGHSTCEPFRRGDLEILPVPISLDNYAYIITDLANGSTVVVDPSDPDTVLDVLAEKKLVPGAVLTTHKHWDHSGGNTTFKERHPAVSIHGSPSCPGVTCSHEVDEEIREGRLIIQALQTPGHTTDHIVYLLDGTAFGAPPCLFSGDLLFVGGIGRMFECPAEMMLGSLDRVCSLDESTLVWPGHEYAKNNLEFASSLEPDHPAVCDKYDWVGQQRQTFLTTVPSLLEKEKQYNPYLRTRDPDLWKAVGLSRETEEIKESDRAAMLLELRKKKDSFKYIL